MFCVISSVFSRFVSFCRFSQNEERRYGYYAAKNSIPNPGPAWGGCGICRSLGYKSGNVVADWRAGRSGSYRGKLREIAEKYNVTVDWLCGNSPQIEKPALPAEDGLGGESLGALLARLTPAEKQRVRDFAAGLLAARNG